TAGVNGAQPGFQMEAHSALGNDYFQEFLPGVAVDEALVSGLNLTVSAGHTYHGVLRTTETSALELGTSDFKYYAPGVGLIRTDEDIHNGLPTIVTTLSGTRSLAHPQQGNLDTPESSDFAGSGHAVEVSIIGADTDAVNALGYYTFDLTTGVIH